MARVDWKMGKIQQGYGGKPEGETVRVTAEKWDSIFRPKLTARIFLFFKRLWGRF